MAGVPTTYAGLQDSLLAWMDDTTLGDRVQEIIGLTERRLSRKLNTPEMETSTPLAIVNGVATLPSDFMEMRGAYIDYQNLRTDLTLLSPSDFSLHYASDNTGRPSHFSISGDSLMVRPMPDLTYSITLTYKQRLPALSDGNPTNWLLTKWPDLYVAGCLVTAAAYGFEDQRLALLSSNAEALIEEINDAGQKARHTAGPLVMRAPVGDFRRVGVR